MGFAIWFAIGTLVVILLGLAWLLWASVQSERQGRRRR